MKPEHQDFVTKLSKDLEKQGTSFDAFLEGVKLERLLHHGNKKKSVPLPAQEPGTIVTKLNAVDVVFGRGK